LPKETLRWRPQAEGLPWSGELPMCAALNQMYQPIVLRIAGKLVPRIAKTDAAVAWELAAASALKTQGAPILLPRLPVTIMIREYFARANSDVDGPLKATLDALAGVLGREHVQARLVKRKTKEGLSYRAKETWNDLSVRLLVVGKEIDPARPRLEITVLPYHADGFTVASDALLAQHALQALALPPLDAPDPSLEHLC
jgi:hypothetical protein